MPWSNQSGGGWKGGGGGPWGNGGGGQGPWGNGPQRGGGGGGGGNPPDLEELLRRSQDRLRNVLPGGGGNLGAKGVLLAIIVAVAVWLLTGFYRVEQDELGVELVFGNVVGRTQPGLNYNWPYPVGTVYTPAVTRLRETNVGTRELVTSRGISSNDVPQESMMLTGDENIVDVNFKVQWRIKDAVNYLFNVENPEATVKAVAESAMREAVGAGKIDEILTENRAPIQQAVLKLMQETLDSYQAGIFITEVQMQKVDPPTQVIDAFRDVQAARADQERIQNEAQAYANKVVPEARGEAAQVLERANGYRDQTIAEAEGQADRFVKVYEQYRNAPDVTRERIYLETIEKVFRDTDKIIIDDSNGNGVVPYLPLEQLGRTTTGNAPAAGGAR
ncbi:FtsH protease activity modulator HflK [Breoghania sp.]|uniref:FtsH protease activity modulator HflK n=1 Tax=Breoghania sp. TaxID=2065378 RepID=UPI002AA683C1|nr:FtsH protease activity modulator HflK [Breoghania sp.]